MKVLIGILARLVILWRLHYLSYGLLKTRILRWKRWDLNICCRKTDGKGINADTVPHTNLPRLVVVDVYYLPFKSHQFKSVLSFHTI